MGVKQSANAVIYETHKLFEWELGRPLTNANFKFHLKNKEDADTKNGWYFKLTPFEVGISVTKYRESRELYYLGRNVKEILSRRASVLERVKEFVSASKLTIMKGRFCLLLSELHKRPYDLDDIVYTDFVWHYYMRYPSGLVDIVIGPSLSNELLLTGLKNLEVIDHRRKRKQLTREEKAERRVRYKATARQKEMNNVAFDYLEI